MKFGRYLPKGVLLVLCFTVMFGMLAIVPAKAQMYFEDDFSEDLEKSGKWIVVDGEWEVKDEVAILQAAGGGGHRHIVVADDFWDDSWTDYTFEVRIQLIGSSCDVFFKYAQEPAPGEQNLYFWEIRTDAAHIIKNVNGVRTKGVEGASTDGVTENQWHDIKVEVTSKTATGYINGEEKWSIDASDIPNGRIGIGGYQDRESHFDDVKVYGPKGSGAAVSSKGKLALNWGNIKVY